MKVVHIFKYGRLPILADCPLPSRQKGQLLVKMNYAPINPSDLNFYTGLYGVRKDNFVIMGFEGSGTIEESQDTNLIGCKVSVLANKTNGTYANFIVSNPDELLIWPKHTQISLEQLSSFCINPYSCLGMAEIAKQQHYNSIVITAAASTLSKMMVQYLRKKYQNKLIVGLSRNVKYDNQLLLLGFDKVFRMDEFDQIKNNLKQNGPSLFLDCLGGQIAGKIFNTLPPNSTMVNYGRLAKQNLGSIDLSELYFRNKRIRGFWLNTFLNEIDASKLGQIKQEVRLSSELFKPKIRKIFSLNQYMEGLRESLRDQSEGKVLLRLD